MVEDVFSEWGFGARKHAGAEPDAPPPAADGHGQAFPAIINEPKGAAAEPAQEPECAAVNDWHEPSEPAEPARLALALKMAAAGLPVLPLVPGDKVPFGEFKDWTKAGAPENIKPSRDPEEIRRWFDLYPGMNYACVPLADFVIVDVDVRKGGDETVAALPFKLPEDTFVVSTPSGGRHLYYRATAAIRGGTDKLGKGGDVQAGHRYVVGPGCEFRDPGGKKGYTGDYTVTKDAVFLPSPEGLVLACGTAGTRERDENRAPVAEQDRPEDIERAARFLAEAAPAVEGQGGDERTYKVACNLRDFGLTEGTALDMMAGEWNARCLPPWSPEELATKVANAFSYGQNRPAAKSMAALAGGFADAVTLDSTPAASPASAGTPSPLALWSTGRFGKPFRLSDPIDPPEDYLYGLHYIRGIVSATAAPGGFGKSQFALGEAICMAAGRELLGERVYEPLRVWFVSLDDPGRITRKRARAFVRHHGLADADLDDRLVLDGSDTMPPAMVKLVTASREGFKADAATVNAFVAAIRARHVDVLILDPLIKFHAVQENDNPAMNEVGTTLAQIAIAANCAVEVLVHTSKPKGQRITAEHVRGASSFVDAARAVRVVNPMSEEEAHRLGIDEARRPWLFRVDLSKGNLAPPSEARWFKRVSVPIDNGTARMPQGEEFPVVAPYRLPDPVATTTEADVSKALTRLAGGPDGAGSPWRASDKAHGYAGIGIAEALGLDTSDPQTRVTCRKLIKDWLGRGLLVQRYVQSRAEGRAIPHIHVAADWTDKLAALRPTGAGTGEGPIAVEDPHRAGRASDFDGATTIQ